jgi:anti-sigma regulatory factor (Ser/Thr protein kinase)
VRQTSWGQGAGGEFSHQAVYYRAPDGYLGAVLPFVQDGLARSEPVLAAVPPPAAGLLRAGLDGSSGAVTFADMTELGRNPGRIISAVWEFISRHRDRPVRFLGEPFWPARSAAEAREVVRHEALINVAFAAAPVAVLCPYDVAGLAPDIVASAGHTHPLVGPAAEPRPSDSYAGGRVPGAADRPLPAPPAGAEHLAYRRDLRPVRDFVDRFAARSGLDPDRAAELVLAVGELAANTLRHTSGGGVVLAWTAPGEVICQVSDQGQISDPLVGRRRPPDATGLGIWVVHQVCDLVELRTGRDGTKVRVHMRTEASAPRAAGGGQ